MFRASQIYGRPSETQHTPTPRTVRPPARPVAGLAAAGGSWGQNSPGQNSPGSVDWNDPRARDQYRQKVAAQQVRVPAQQTWQHNAGQWQGSQWRQGGGWQSGTQWRSPQPQQPASWRPPAKPASPVPPPWPQQSPRPAPGMVVPAPQAGPNTIVVQGAGIGNLADGELDEACRQVAIIGGFSVHDTVRVIHSGLAHVEFPHREAATQFEEVTRGELTVGMQNFAVRRPVASGSGVAGMNVVSGATPTDTLIVRQLGTDIMEKDLLEAFAKVAPRIRGVKIPKSWSGHPKGHGFVMFHELHEAISALRHFRTQVGTVGGRRVAADFAPVQTFEETVEHEAQKKRADTNIRESHAQALSGPNADMWATYLAMFNDSGNEESSANADTSAMGASSSDGTGKAEEMEPATKRPRTDYAAPVT